MLITDIEPIDKWGKNLLTEKDPDKVIDDIIEEPLRKACKVFRKKGIKTVMSSANKNNVLEDGDKPIEKADVYGSGQQFLKDRPTYEDAGKGYAWIMLDFETFSDENKDWLFSLEGRKGENGEPLGEKAIWFVNPCEMGSIKYSLKVGKIDYELLEATMPKEKIPRGIEIDERAKEFEKRHIVLAYHWRIISSTNCNIKNASK